MLPVIVPGVSQHSAQPWTNFSYQDEPWADFSILEVAAAFLLSSAAKRPNLELKTRPKQLLGSLPLVTALPGTAVL